MLHEYLQTLQGSVKPCRIAKCCQSRRTICGMSFFRRFEATQIRSLASHHYVREPRRSRAIGSTKTRCRVCCSLQRHPSKSLSYGGCRSWMFFPSVGVADFYFGSFGNYASPQRFRSAAALFWSVFSPPHFGGGRYRSLRNPFWSLLSSFAANFSAMVRGQRSPQLSLAHLLNGFWCEGLMWPFVSIPSWSYVVAGRDERIVSDDLAFLCKNGRGAIIESTQNFYCKASWAVFSDGRVKRRIAAPLARIADMVSPTNRDATLCYANVPPAANQVRYEVNFPFGEIGGAHAV